MRVLLDTCALIHIVEQPHRLSAHAHALVNDPASEVFLSVATIPELACLAAINRVNFAPHWKIWYRKRIEDNGWNLVDIDARVAEEAWSLPDDFHRDPTDRILVATARVHRLLLVTTDRLILDYPHVDSTN
jgi:PIN domain nuclease of toxin-antitoxin system